MAKANSKTKTEKEIEDLKKMLRLERINYDDLHGRYQTLHHLVFQLLHDPANTSYIRELRAWMVLHPYHPKE